MNDNPKDQNHVYTRFGVLNTDGKTVIPIDIDPVTGGISIDTTSTISFSMVNIAPTGPDYQKLWLFEGTDGKAYPAVVTSAGALLIDLA